MYLHWLVSNQCSNCVPFLAPANEVLGKAMFLNVSVSPQEEGISVWCNFLSSCLVQCSFWGVSVTGHMFLLGGLCLGVSVLGSLCLEVSLSREGSLSREVSVWRSLYWDPAWIRKVGCSHPTGILCSFFFHSHVFYDINWKKLKFSRFQWSFYTTKSCN